MNCAVFLGYIAMIDHSWKCLPANAFNTGINFHQQVFWNYFKNNHVPYRFEP